MSCITTPLSASLGPLPSQPVTHTSRHLSSLLGSVTESDTEPVSPDLDPEPLPTSLGLFGHPEDPGQSPRTYRPRPLFPDPTDVSLPPGTSDFGSSLPPHPRNPPPGPRPPQRPTSSSDLPSHRHHQRSPEPLPTTDPHFFTSGFHRSPVKTLSPRSIPSRTPDTVVSHPSVHTNPSTRPTPVPPPSFRSRSFPPPRPLYAPRPTTRTSPLLGPWRSETVDISRHKYARRGHLRKWGPETGNLLGVGLE